MAIDGFVGLALGAVGLGVVHGVEPGHGWPVAATYALDRTNTWLAGLAASTILGIGHLISSIAMVVAFFWAKEFFGLTDVGWMSYVAGGLLILLGLREYRLYRRGGHTHDHGHADPDQGHEEQDGDHAPTDGHRHGPATDAHAHNGGHADREHSPLTGHDHSHDVDHEHGHDHSHGPDHAHGHSHDHAHDHDHDHAHGHGHDHAGGVVGRLVSLLPVDLIPDKPDPSEASERGILGIAAFAFALGFAHEEEFEIIALCVGSNHCLELMLIYALTVIAAIVGFTLLLIAGYEHYEERVEAYADYLPLFSAAVLVLMGLGFLLQVF